MVIVRPVHQLGGDSYAAACLSHAAFQYVTDLELACNPRNIDVLALERRLAARVAQEKKDVRKVTAPAGVAARQKIVNLYVPEKTKKTQIIGGSAAEAAKELVRRLRDEARVIQ